MTSFQSSRLLFSHLGLLEIDSVTRQSNPSDNSDLIRLRASSDLVDELKCLDQMPHTHHDTWYVYNKGLFEQKRHSFKAVFSFLFYVRAGMTTKEEIYGAAQGRNKNSLDTAFIEFLFSLGAPTNIENHSYWSGNTRTSYKIG